jgi:hypothetical protein
MPVLSERMRALPRAEQQFEFGNSTGGVVT